jgi:hypothetical protein
MSMGVRSSDSGLHADLDRALERRAGEIRAILHEYRVPLLERAE